jgi:CRP/FNR family transcriptional regulator
VAEEANSADHIFRVESGALRVVRQLPDGRRCIMNFLMTGDYFGLGETGAYKSSVEAVTDARIVRYQRSAIDQLCERNSRAGRHFLDLLGRQLSAVQDRLVLLSQKTALERLATFLLSMAGRSRNNGSAVALPMDRSDIGDYLGLRIETVSRILTTLRRRKVIDLPDFHSFVVLDRDALESMIEGNE